MTDNEIIKALKCCSVHPMKCKECPYQGNECCTNAHRKDALDLINRQKAEIERLQKECEITRAYIHNNGLEWGLISHLEFCKNQRAEARKEFAEKLKGKIDISTCGYSNEEIVSNIVSNIEYTIDNLVKEMESSE